MSLRKQAAEVKHSRQPSGAASTFDLQNHIKPGKHKITGGHFAKTKDSRTVSRWSLLRRIQKSQARREERCYKILQGLGVPCPDVVEVIEERSSRIGVVTYSQITVELIEDSVDLRLLATLDCFSELRNNYRWRKRVVEAVARWIRHMHEHHIYIQKLHFGNILTTPDPAANEVDIYFIDITSNMKGWVGSRWYKRTKDLAYMYRDARQWATLREQIYFMHELLGTRKLSARDRALMRRIVKYAERKWGMKTSLGTPVDC